ERSLNWKANAHGGKAINPRRPSFLLIQPPLAAFGGQRARTCRIAVGSRRRGTPSKPSNPRPPYGDEDRGRSAHCTSTHTYRPRGSVTVCNIGELRMVRNSIGRVRRSQWLPRSRQSALRCPLRGGLCWA